MHRSDALKRAFERNKNNGVRPEQIKRVKPDQIKKRGNMTKYKIALLPGDGIGNEVIPAGQVVLEALAETAGQLQFDCQTFDWGSDYYRQNGKMMRSEEHTSELQSRGHLVCRLLLEKKKKRK